MSSVSLSRLTTTRPLHQRFGLDVRGLDLREVDQTAIDEIRREIERHGLVVFRDQLLNDDELVAFGRKVGDGRMEESARNVSLAAGRRLVAYLTNLKDDAGHALGFGGADTDYWHSDQEFRRAPATLASLYCLIPSPKGGATSFATTAVEHLDLPEGLLDMLRPLRSTRRPAPTHDNAEHIEVSHPVIMTSPILGKDVLYVSENLIRFVGVEAEESARLKNMLLARILAPANIYSHAWRMGDLIVYDNTQLLHRREAFEGIRWLKATKIFAPRASFAVPQGEVLPETVA